MIVTVVGSGNVFSAKIPDGTFHRTNTGALLGREAEDPAALL